MFHDILPNAAAPAYVRSSHSAFYRRTTIFYALIGYRRLFSHSAFRLAFASSFLPSFSPLLPILVFYRSFRAFLHRFAGSVYDFAARQLSPLPTRDQKSRTAQAHSSFGVPCSDQPARKTSASLELAVRAVSALPFVAVWHLRILGRPPFTSIPRVCGFCLRFVKTWFYSIPYVTFRYVCFIYVVTLVLYFYCYMLCLVSTSGRRSLGRQTCWKKTWFLIIFFFCYSVCVAITLCALTVYWNYLFFMLI